MLFNFPCQQPNPTINYDDKYVEQNHIYLFSQIRGHKLEILSTFNIFVLQHLIKDFQLCLNVNENI